MIEENITKLKKEFIEIKNKGYIKSIRKGPTGVGATFEKLLNKSEESFEIPDYHGIEIKTKRAYSKSYITLFNAVPTGSGYYEVKRLRDKYGYPDPLDKKLKQINNEAFADKLTKVGLWYYFILKVDRDNEKLVLQIYNWNQVLIDSSTYWDFDILKEKLMRKLQVLALVKAWSNKINGEEYFKYFKMNFYIVKGFGEFINLIEEGKIKVLLKIGNYHDKQRYGQVNAHGVSFCIKEENLIELFDIYR